MKANYLLKVPVPPTLPDSHLFSQSVAITTLTTTITTITMDMDPPVNSANSANVDMEYETDNISITSTVSSTKESKYDAVQVLSERPSPDDDCDKMYLIEWENYPMHRCTWEPEYHLDETNLLELWELEKQRLGEAGAQKLMEENESKYYAAVAQAKEAHEHRQAKRLKKRRQLWRRARYIVTDSESESEGEAIEHVKVQKRSRQEQEGNPNTVLRARDTMQHNRLLMDPRQPLSLGPDDLPETPESSLFVGQDPPARRAPLQQSDSSSSSQEEGEEEDTQSSDDLVMGKMRSRKKMGRSKMRTTEDKMDSGRPAWESQLPSARAVQSATIQVRRDVSARQTSRITSKESSSKVNEGLRRTSQSSSAPVPSSTSPITPRHQTKPNSLKSMKRTEPPKTARGIKLVNEPRTQSTPWRNGDKAFSTLKFRRNAAKKGQAEGTPELGALRFVGQVPPGMNRSTRPISNDDIYGRRETGTRRLQELDVDDTPRRTSVHQAEPLNDWEADKIPLVCPEWRLSNNCKFGPRRCRFMHRNQDAFGQDLPLAPPDGHVPPKYHKPPITCRYWLLDPNGCMKSDAECPYAHKNTGHVLSETRLSTEVIDPERKPVSEQQTINRASRKLVTCPYWLKQPAGCTKTDDECIFAHRNMGVVTDGRGHNFPIDIAMEPAFKSRAHPSQQGRVKPSLSSSEFTCFYWTKNKCHFTPETCKHQHRHTGKIAPLRRESNTSSAHYEYQHENTGYQSDTQAETLGPAASRSRWNIPPPPSTSPPLPPPPPAPHPPVPVVQQVKQADTLCLGLKASIEQYCKLDFLDMFTKNDGSALLDRTAFLLYHPEQHLEELELITRWLLMHHVEVSNVWYDGSWDRFKSQIVRGGTGIIVTHPEFQHFTELPGFGLVLQKEIRIWSVGIQDGIECDPNLEASPAVMRYDRIEIFPLGGFIYITDEVFEEKPQLALKIVQQFLEKIAQLRQLEGPIAPWHTVNDACLLWRLCTRPELTEHIFQRCEAQAAEVDAGDPCATSRAELYTILAEHNLVDDSSEPLSLIPDKFPIISERRAISEDPHIDYFNALARSQQEANLCMIRYYSLIQADMRRDYRHFFVVHTDPTASYVQDWKHEIQTIVAVVTPEKCLEELQKDGSKSLFDFCERYMPGLQAKDEQK